MRRGHWVNGLGGGSTGTIELLDIGEAAGFLNVSEASLRRWTNDESLPCLRIGRRRERRFRLADLVAFIEEPAGRKHPANGIGGTMTRKGSQEAVAAIHGNHLCGIYGSDEARLDLAVPFLLEGLQQKSVCFLVGPSKTQRQILKAMKKKRASLNSDIAAGRLIVSEHQESAADQIRFFETAMTPAEDEGVESFRLFADMWGLRLLVSAKEMIELEVEFEQVIIARFPMIALCAYDARKFSGIELLDALKDHEDTFRFPLGRTIA
jgi:transcriptional repressor of dcmA and dcmR